MLLVCKVEKVDVNNEAEKEADNHKKAADFGSLESEMKGTADDDNHDENDVFVKAEKSLKPLAICVGVVEQNSAIVEQIDEIAGKIKSKFNFRVPNHVNCCN